jgi:16S rRNA (cytosine967-C5)-methyltransferase
MLFHFLQCKAVVDILNEIFLQNKQADKAIENNFKQNKNRGKNDRSFIAETVYEIVRYYRLYKYICNDDNNFWHLLHAYIFLKYNYVLKYIECSTFNSISYSEKFLSAKKHFEIENAIPDWLHVLGKRELPETWEQTISAMNNKAEVYLRVNTLLTNTQAALQALLNENIEAEIIFDNCIKIEQKQNIFSLDLYKKGFIEVQDGGSQQIAPFLEVSAGMRVIDACAGAGGKSLHLAAMMKNKGKIIALDIFDKKLQNLRKRATRAGVEIIETRLIESNKTIKRLENSCDRLLLDVPCSGLGVLKRNPDAKWKLNEEKIHEINIQQQNIINSYNKMLRKGGIMVYATCSVLPSENEVQVQKFLQDHENFVLIDEKYISPYKNKFDGFYMAKIQKV